MRALGYLLGCSIRNFFLRLLHKPGRLAGYLLVLALLALVMLSSVLQEPTELEMLRPMEELYAVVFSLYLFGLGSGVKKGLSTGGTFFSMADVNLLFCSPLSPKKILVYGLVHQTGMTVLMGAVLLFQASTLRTLYGCGLDVLFLIFVGFVLNQMAGELVAVVIYAVSSGNQPRRKWIRLVSAALLLPLGAGVLWQGVVEKQGMDAVTQILSSPLAELYPFSGWLKGGIRSLMEQDAILFGVYCGAFVLLFAALAFFLCLYRVDYYEDVLLFSEEQAKVKEKAKTGEVAEGKIRSSQKSRRTGRLKGKKASALLYKHLLENRRTGIWMFDMMSLVQIGVGLGFLLIMKVTMGKEGDAAVLMTSLLCFSAYFQMFTTGAGRWGKELTKQFIYLIPDSPFRKLAYACGESVWKNFLEGILLFVVGGLLAGADFISILMCIIVRTSLSLLFIAGNVLMERLFGDMTSKGLIVMLYFILSILLLIPGVVAGLALSFLCFGQIILAAALLFDALANLILSALILGLCQDILHRVDITAVH